MPAFFKSKAEFEAFLARYRGSPVRPADVEPDLKHEPAPADAVKAAHPRYRINIHSRRRRLTDADAICGKFAVDGLVLGGLLPDDSPEWVEAVSYSQEKADVDETVIDVILVDTISPGKQRI